MVSLLKHLVKYNQASNQLFGYVVISLLQSVPCTLQTLTEWVCLCQPSSRLSTRSDKQASSCLQQSAAAPGALLHSDSFWNGSLREVQPRTANCAHKHELSLINKTLYLITGGPGSSVGIATDYRLDGPRIESRWGRDFTSVKTHPGAHPAYCKLGAVSFPGVNCGRGVLLTTHPLLLPWLWKSRAITLHNLWATPGL